MSYLKKKINRKKKVSKHLSLVLYKVSLRRLARVTKISGICWITICLVLLYIATLIMIDKIAIISLSDFKYLEYINNFNNIYEFKDATFSALHTNIIQWPLYFLLNALGISKLNIIIVFAIQSMALVTFVACILWQFCRDFFKVGLILLLITSVILLIPVDQNTINYYSSGYMSVCGLDLVVLISSVFLISKNKKFNSKSYWLSVALTGILFASNMTYICIFVLACLSAIIWNKYIVRNIYAYRFDVRWALSIILAFFIALIILTTIKTFRLTHLDYNITNYFSLYNKIDFVSLGYSIQQSAKLILINMGVFPTANAFNFIYKIDLKQISYATLLFIPYLLNLSILIFGVLVFVKLNRHKLAKTERRAPLRAYYLILWIAGSTLIFNILFWKSSVFKVSIYIIPIAIFITLLLFIKNTNLRVKKAILLTVLILAILPLTFYVSNINWKIFQQDLLDQNQKTIIDSLNNKNIHFLIGNYNQILPIAESSTNSINLIPLNECTDIKKISYDKRLYQSTPPNVSIAYWAHKDNNGNFNGCGLDNIVRKYGLPDESVIINGTNSNPNDILLIYYSGVSNNLNGAPISQEINDLDKELCLKGKTLNIVAHPDDDLLFLSPDLLNDIKDGKCVRSVFLTTGQWSFDMDYVKQRRLGILASYASMAGVSDSWKESIYYMGKHKFIIMTLNDRDNISILFMDLPDGNLDGSGFEKENHDSLEKLWNNNILTIDGLDGNKYDRNDLIQSLRILIANYKPSIIRTQNFTQEKNIGDHSDHKAVGYFVKAADNDQTYNHKIIGYVGYPIKLLPENISNNDSKQKESAYLIYASYDDKTCKTELECYKPGTSYGAYWKRQYRVVN